MHEVIVFARFVIQASIKGKTEASEKFIEFDVPWGQAVVHSVMSNNEKACMEEAAENNKENDC